MNLPRHKWLAVALALAFWANTVSLTQSQGPSSGEFLLSEGRAGQIEVGMPVDEVYQRIGRERIKLVDLFMEGLFSPAIEINIVGATVVPALVAAVREWPCPGFSVWGIDVRDRRFRTREGLGVGSTVGDLRRHHPVQLSHEEGESAIVPALKMSFRLDSSSGADEVRVTNVWLWPDPVGVHQRRCVDR